MQLAFLQMKRASFSARDATKHTLSNTNKRNTLCVLSFVLVVAESGIYGAGLYGINCFKILQNV